MVPHCVVGVSPVPGQPRGCLFFVCFISYESLQWFPSAAKRSFFDERQEIRLSVNLRRKNTVRDYIDLVIVILMPPGQPTVKNCVSTLSADSRATYL